MFSERLPLWLKKIGLLDAEQKTNSNSLQSEDNHKQMMVELRAASVELNEKKAKIKGLKLTEEESANYRNEFSKWIQEQHEAIKIKYGGNITKPVEEKRNSCDWMYDSE
jgi:hypothetical protein